MIWLCNGLDLPSDDTTYEEEYGSVGKNCSRYRFQEMVLAVGNSALHWVRDGQTCGTQVIPVQNVLHSKRDGDKVLVDLGQTLHIG